MRAGGDFISVVLATDCDATGCGRRPAGTRATVLMAVAAAISSAVRAHVGWPPGLSAHPRL